MVSHSSGISDFKWKCIVLILLLIQLGVVYCVYKYPTEPYPSQPETNNRTAILVTGQLRSGNLTWFSGKLRANSALRMFGVDDPVTAIETQLEWLFRPLALYGGIDVFMYVQAHPETKASDWNGDPDTYEPVVNDTFVCTPYSKHPVFANHTGNRIFCLVEPEVELMTPFISDFKIWKNYTYGAMPHLKEQVLQQLYGMYRANLAAKQFSVANFIDYTYKVRIRPDIALTQGLRREILFARGKCDRTIWCGNNVIMKNGWEDSFNFGYAADMDRLLDRYNDLITLRFDVPLIRGDHWDLEDHLTQLLYIRYGICLQPYYDVWVVVIRKSIWGLNSWKPQPNTIQWRQIN